MGQSFLFDKLKRLIDMNSKALLTVSFAKGLQIHGAPWHFLPLPQAAQLAVAAFPMALGLAFPPFPTEGATGN